jgi:transposase
MNSHLSSSAQTYVRAVGGKADEPLLICHREERSDVAIHLEFFVDCRSRQASFAMTNRVCSLEAPTTVLRLPPTGRKGEFPSSLSDLGNDILKVPGLKLTCSRANSTGCYTKMPLAFSRTVRPLESENILDIIAYIIAFLYIILTIVAMATRFVIVDRNTPLLLPPDLRDWVPADHLAHFVIDAMEAIDLREVRVNTRGTGDAQYPPGMLLGLLTYSYATGTFGSRRIEQSTDDNVAVRLITGDTHPDHDTICTFRRENKALVSESFVKILQLAQELKLVKFGQLTVSVDGTKIAANASKHAAVSYARAGEQLAQLELEVEQLLAKA